MRLGEYDTERKSGLVDGGCFFVCHAPTHKYTCAYTHTHTHTMRKVRLSITAHFECVTPFRLSLAEMHTSILQLLQ